jgi:hypothetical protein
MPVDKFINFLRTKFQRRTSTGAWHGLLNSDADPHSVEAIEWSLWAMMLTQCDRCGVELDVPHWSERADEDVSAWAAEWAPSIHAKGWSLAGDRMSLVCPNCRVFPRAPTS